VRYEAKYCEQVQTDIEALTEQVKYLMSVVAFLEDARILFMPMYKQPELFDAVRAIYEQHMINKQ
jgi:hypothetical protein|tara:strand:+ start:1001 stop:1195 length:195 start_codon:yes stop_codon:yes gene_type:complete